MCADGISFLKENGIVLKVRDLAEEPLTRSELSEILGYLNPKHFIDMSSATFKKEKLDQKMLPRGEMLELIEKNPDLLRHPIIVSGRLITVGANRKQLIDMLQISISGNGSDKHSRTHLGNK